MDKIRTKVTIFMGEDKKPHVEIVEDFSDYANERSSIHYLLAKHGFIEVRVNETKSYIKLY